MAAEDSGAGSAEPPIPAHRYVDQDTTDEFLDRAPPTYEGRTPEESSAAIDALLADAKAGKVKLPPLPPLSEG